MPDIKKNLPTDDAVIMFAVDLLKDENFQNKFYFHLDQRGIGEDDILNSTEINAQEKVILLKQIKKEKAKS